MKEETIYKYTVKPPSWRERHGEIVALIIMIVLFLIVAVVFSVTSFGGTTVEPHKSLAEDRRLIHENNKLLKAIKALLEKDK